ncbi:MAG: HAD family hydrolase [Candidatus Thermoplasmatota archaeon]|nr:HAD family hydrolase [Candidatus Thermoplasmatota archaeon]MBS3790335.1 HAD family hydrolase [Candidatus Thermoplasmatota archaeon]
MDDKLIIFDLDGTLYKTEEVSVPALKDAFSRFGIMLSGETILNQFGEPTDQIIENLVPEEKEHLKDRIKKAIIEKESELIPEKATLYDGVKSLLKDLKESGYELAICSNGRTDYIERVLKTTSIESYFTSIKGHEKGKKKSDLIQELMSEFSVESAVMVGDRYHDIEAAKKAGVKSVGALYGYGDAEAKKADFVIEEPEEILSIISD